MEIDTVTHVDAEKRVDESLVKIWKLKFGHKVKFLSRLWAQGLVKILKLKFKIDQYFANDACLRMEFNLGWDSEARFGQDFEA